MSIKRAVAAVLITLFVATPHALAQSPVFVVRHAERADAGAPKSEPDPDLSAIGHARAQALATTLKDAGISAIFVTPLKRTQQTAAPVAKALGLTPIVVAANDTAGLLERVRAHRGAALVVGHSNTVPDIVKGLGVDGDVTVGDAEFDRLFVVVRDGGAARLIPLRFR
jgi:phosphohistidine phosphatase SixA